MDATYLLRYAGVRTFHTDLEGKFQEEHCQRLFLQCRTTALLFAIVATVYNSVQVLVPMQPVPVLPFSARAINPVASIAIAWCIPLVFTLFRNWSVKNYQWVVMPVLAYFIVVRILDMGVIRDYQAMYEKTAFLQGKAFDDLRISYDLYVTRLHVRFVLLYVWLMMFFRVPYRSLLFFCLATVPLIEYVFLFHARGVNGHYFAISFFFVVVLGLIAAWNLEDRERLIFAGTVEVADAHRRILATHEAQRALIQAEYAKAAKSAEAKSEFLRQAMHDVRGLFGALGINFTTLSLAREHRNDEVMKRSLALVDRCYSVLTGLVSDLFNLTSYEMDKESTAPESINLCGFLREIEALHAPMAINKGVSIRIRLGEGHPIFVQADRVALKRALVNLITNAIKFTPALRGTRPGRVYIYAKYSQGKVMLCVSDNGVGIAKERESEIWEYGITSNGTANETGHGIGLALVRAICRSQKILLDLRSVADRGTRFVLGIPVGTALPEVATGVVDAGCAPARPNLKILFVENEACYRDTVLLLLTSWQNEVVSGDSFESCLEKIPGTDWYPDVLITDFQLGGTLRGSEVIRSVRRYFRRDIPAIILTGDRGAEPVAAKNNLGNVDILFKSKDTSELCRTLGRLLPNDS